MEAKGLKKDFSTMSQSDVEDILKYFDGGADDDIVVLERKKEKLGKSKAIKARIEMEEKYADVYIVTSDKHIVIVYFVAPTLLDLNSEEVKKIKL